MPSGPTMRSSPVMTWLSMSFDPFRAPGSGPLQLLGSAGAGRWERRLPSVRRPFRYGREYWSITREIARWQTRQKPTGLRVNMMQSISER